MRGKAPRESWHFVPKSGFIFDIRRRPGSDNSHCSNLFVRPAHSSNDAAQGLGLETVSSMLESHFDGRGIYWPLGEHHEGLSTGEWDGWTRLNTACKEHVANCHYIYNYNKIHRASFRMFAESELTANGILEFAMKYGSPVLACSVLLWHEEVLAMRRALRVWELLRTKDLSQLRRHFKTREVLSGDEKNGRSERLEMFMVVYDSHPHLRDGQAPKYPDRRSMEYVVPSSFNKKCIVEDGNVELAAGLYLQDVINDRLQKFTTSDVEFDGMTFRRVFCGKPRMELLGKMWLQVERLVCGCVELRRCLGCGELFSPQNRRSDTKYCFDACRGVAHRRRKEDNNRQTELFGPQKDECRVSGRQDKLAPDTSKGGLRNGKARSGRSKQ